MDWSERHTVPPDASFDGGNLDCGNGLLLLIRRHIDPLTPGQVLEVRSSESSVEDDLPAWARLTGNALLSRTRSGDVRSYLIRKAGTASSTAPAPRHPVDRERIPAGPSPTETAAAPGTIKPFAVMGVGSWPRPAWLVRALHERLAGRLPEDEFQQYADDAVRLAVAAQERAGVDVVTDGEQRRDNYASFVATRLDNCQLIPITDLLPYVTDPEHFAEELRALDVPAEKVRHPAVFGRLARSRPLTGHELNFARAVTAKPVKVALPGPYLLTRTMWLECVSDKAYLDREALARDIVSALRAEANDLLAAGAAVVQFDEPVLTEVVFARPTARQSFMCGALSERRALAEELAFAAQLLRAVLDGLPRERVALHVCRGNWSRDESVALSGPYTPLVPLLAELPVGTLFLELATPRAGELAPLADLPKGCRVGVGVVNQKLDRVEPIDEIVAKATAAAELFGPERVLLNPDCGFATFADSPVSSAGVAEAKLGAIAQAARVLRARYGLG
ncbi:5-methyltetrahydropteroyltriglutamate--homocysteine methyltransferase [Gemmata obscuriglobus]|uniref:5-methyltetrahydropteroyltriglutamate--homocysteine methyltransferase n=1 Tax=Gemmata obscuriglobus TaxID=114 RepID=A0A2Z3H1R2_9BACT|nr:sulfurtransferase TusA family protein [Gemmata obscuriglobus]AWM37506.1 5-methyltetrahydropteroyltriglutamate--homocysteine methyltransferase [Gemmata obscuriglobus]QEG29724.1 5-methyltetrahydropteroyltriglutamate--homocysteine methyltransferase [Gemmata obscuriglobus]VTS09041.1 5-methyltetrahydropteroyltriglutamate--homocysteine methyltransferase : Methyltransferase OS=Pseudomonas stutzeri NF13 GN=B381_18264 PE=4 SV=1: TusA: Meth_synt_2: Meth_synt_2 [Gemmata obscuriglobus UQM 2246]